jgi:hypothetical protein
MSRPRRLSEPSRITVSFDRAEIEALRAIATSRKKSKAEIVRTAVREWATGISHLDQAPSGERPLKAH